MILYDTFLRKYTVRKLGQIAQPGMHALQRLELPKTSVLHYWGEAINQIGPPDDLYILRSAKEPIQQHDINGYAPELALVGLPQRRTENLTSEITRYYNSHRLYRRMRDIARIRQNPEQQLVINYSMVDRLFRYQENQRSHYNAWRNKFATMVTKVGEAIDLTGRPQFLVFGMPELVPGLTAMREVASAGGEIPITRLGLFASDEARCLLQLWLWLSEWREHSIFNLLKQAHYERVNIVLQVAGRWTSYNLGLLDAMRLTPRAQADEWRARAQTEPGSQVPVPITKGTEANMLASSWLRGVIVLSQARSDSAYSADEALTETTEITDDQDRDSDLVMVRDAQGRSITVKASQAAQYLTPEQQAQVEQTELQRILAHEQELERQRRGAGEDITTSIGGIGIEEFEHLINQDLAEQDQIVERVEEAKLRQSLGPSQVGAGTLTEQNANPPSSYDEALLRICDDFAEKGLLTATEYRRFVRNSQAYKETIKVGDQTLEQFIQIDPEQLKIDWAAQGPTIDTVRDQSLRGDAMAKFHRQYNRTLLHKDVARSFLNLQYAGIALTNFSIHHRPSILGDRTIYEARLDPVDGEATNVRIIIPTVNDQGIFRINGVKYRFRTQQGTQVPIKKTKPTEVALTSGYGKLFVSRTARRVNDWGHWITQTIRSLARAGTGQVTELEAMPSYVADIKRPYVFTTLAREFTRFTLKLADGRSAQFLLGASTMLDHLGAERFDALVAQGQVPIGLVGDLPLVVNGAGTFSVVHGPDTEVLGEIESLLGLDPARAPIEYAEAKISRKDVPLGFMLAYEMGLEQLIALLKPTLRRIPAGQQIPRDPNEYRLTFADETLVLRRDEQPAAMILAGLTKFHRSLRQYPIHDFNTQDVYLNILEDLGMPPRIGASITSLNQMFIDPITRDLLTDMKEPTNFRGLLVRSAQLLTDDYVPEVPDRIRGYERFATAIYSELVKAVRAHRFKPSRAKSPLDIHPYAAYNNITTDTAKLQVKDINPVEDVKQVDALSFSGNGGRSSLSMTRKDRLFTRKDRGLVSESTVDSGKVAVNNYAVTSPKINSVRGTYDPFVKGDGIGHLLSTAAMLSPYATTDDCSYTTQSA